LLVSRVPDARSRTADAVPAGASSPSPGRPETTVKRYKRYLPIVAALLVAAGVSLDQYGIDLRSLANGGGGAFSGASRDAGRDATSGAGSDLGSLRGGGAAVADLPHWSDTRPNLNLKHVFLGEINRSGKPVGYHSRPGGQDPDGARVADVRDTPNRLGVYTARVEIRDGDRWLTKNSSFFPDAMSTDDVISAVMNAYRESANPNAQPFEGPSGLGFRIQGYTSNRGGINTAYPIYVRNP